MFYRINEIGKYFELAGTSKNFYNAKKLYRIDAHTVNEIGKKSAASGYSPLIAIKFYKPCLFINQLNNSFQGHFRFLYTSRSYLFHTRAEYRITTLLGSVTRNREGKFDAISTSISTRE